MARKPYESDLTDAEWSLIEPLIPPARPGGRPRSVDMRRVIDGIRYTLRCGGGWRRLPHDLPDWHTCWFYFDRFSGDDTWQRLCQYFHPAARALAGRDPDPSTASIDAQSVRTTKKGGRRAASATTRANMSKAASDTSRPTRSAGSWRPASRARTFRTPTRGRWVR